MSPLTADDFERRYRADPDPWRYRSSEYEQAKYAATLAACGAGPFARALELGGSIGVFSARLAPRCRSLTTLDVSPTAVRLAAAELAPHPQAQAVLGTIPDAIPEGPFDLVVASEILYYLDETSLIETLNRLEDRIARSGRVVCVHWRAPGPDHPLSAAQVHEMLRTRPWLARCRSEPTDEYLLDVLERR
jgi:predicted O-methyltransferase YrrM